MQKLLAFTVAGIVVFQAAAAQADGAAFTLRDDKGNVIVNRATVAAWKVIPQMTALTLETADDCATLEKMIRGQIQSRNQGSAKIEYTSVDAAGKERVTATETLAAVSILGVALVLDDTGFHCDASFDTSTTQKLTKRIQRSKPSSSPVDAVYFELGPGYSRTKVQSARVAWDYDHASGIMESASALVLAAPDPTLQRLKATNYRSTGTLGFVHTNADGTTTTAIEVSERNAFVLAATTNPAGTFSVLVSYDGTSMTIP